MMDSSADIQIQEGFLCPYCIVRFDEVGQLLAHLNQHEEGSFKNDVFLPFKGFFDKARQKLSKLESLMVESSDSFSINDPPTFIDQTMEEEKPELGPVTSHTSYFNKERNSRVDDVAVETNKLIIRLDKLITEMPSEPSKRKGIFETFEQEVIPWLSDSESQQCNLCGVKFSLTKRKHHCRLCGKILCSSCSNFLTFTYARKLVNPAYAVMYQVEIDSLKRHQQSEASRSSSSIDQKLNPSTSNLNLRNAERFLMSGLSKLKQQRDGTEEGEDHIRVCRYCHDLLEKRDQQVEQRTKTPMIVQIYERLFTLIVEVDRLFQSYCTMSRSLSYGESKYELQMARDLRIKIVRLQEQIDYVCKKLAAVKNEYSELITEESQSPLNTTHKTSTTSRELVLFQNIQRFTYEFLRDMALTMPNLPDNEEYAKLQLAQKISMETKIQNERAFAAAAAVQSAVSALSIKNTTPSGHSLSPPPSSQHQRLYRPSENTGSWAPSKTALTSSISSFAVNPFDEQKSIDPVEEQIIYIQALIRQAATDGRTEIVETLSKNLNELKEELLLRKQTCENTSTET